MRCEEQAFEAWKQAHAELNQFQRRVDDETVGSSAAPSPATIDEVRRRSAHVQELLGEFVRLSGQQAMHAAEAAALARAEPPKPLT